MLPRLLYNLPIVWALYEYRTSKNISRLPRAIHGAIFFISSYSLKRCSAHASMKCKFQINMVIFLHVSAPSHTTKAVSGTLETLSWKFYPMRLTHQTCLLLITTCLHQWVTHLLSSILVYSKIKKQKKKRLDKRFAAKGEHF